MLIGHPGTWQQFQFRPDNKGLNVMEMKSKYLHEQYLFEAQMLNLQQMQQQNMFMNGTGGGGPLPSSEPPTPTYTTALQLTFNDTLENVSIAYIYDVTSATAWNDSGRFAFNGSNSNFGTVEIVDDFNIILKGNEEGLAVTIDTFSGDTYLTLIEDLNANCITEIQDGAFADTVLERAVLDNMTIIGTSAFARCASLTSVRFSNLTTIPNGDSFTQGVFTECSLDSDNLGVMFPALVTVGDFAFYRTSVPNITSSTITSIGFRAFLQSVSLVSIELTSAVTFGLQAFEGCSLLDTIILPTDCTFPAGTTVFQDVSSVGGETATVSANNAANSNITYLDNTLGWTINP